MLPKSGSRRRKFPGGRGDGDAEDVSNSQTAVRSSRTKGKGKASASATVNKRLPRSQPRPSESQVPEVFRSMLGTLHSSLDDPGDPGERRRRKRIRRTENEAASEKADAEAAVYTPDHVQGHGGDILGVDEEVVASPSNDEEMSEEFEDVVSAGQNQAGCGDSDDDSAESDFDWEEVDIGTTIYNAEEDNSHLELTLNPDQIAPRKALRAKRRAITKADRILRLEVHKIHLLCLIAFVYRRNWWCNDEEVQMALEPFLSQKISACFNPAASHSSFGKAESLKKGLTLCIEMWSSKYHITEKGMRRSFWIEDEQKGSDLEPPSDLDPVYDKSDFRTAARKLSGSRDVGAQLFCAFLRRAGLDVRLVCSLQVVSFSPSAKPITSNTFSSNPTYVKDPPVSVSTTENPVLRENESRLKGIRPAFKLPRWLSHVNPANYLEDEFSEPSSRPQPPKKRIHNSPYPIFWVEVLDMAHLKWIPVNPFDATVLNKPKSFEPPASDPDNNLSYVVAFEDDGIAKDVTRRYANAYNSKTRKNRVESLGGEKWWEKRLKFYSRFGTRSEVEIDTLENIYLADMEAREPMPRNIADFKGHPTYALQRHLRKNEVLVGGATVVGTTAVGKDASGKKKLENVYRRRDVRTVRSADKWFRAGRVVKDGEQPRKIVMRRDKGDEDVEDDPGAGLYDIQQTEIYEAPPVVNGRVPKNSYGNLDVYVPSMVPPGACHLTDDLAKLAAQTVGVDYAEAVTGFSFKGRKGVPVVKGVVVAAEYREAVDAVVETLHDEEQDAERDRRSRAALKLWKQFMVALKIVQHVEGYKEEWEEEPAAVQEDEAIQDQVDDADYKKGMESEEYVDDGEGGFFR